MLDTMHVSTEENGFPPFTHYIKFNVPIHQLCLKICHVYVPELTVREKVFPPKKSIMKLLGPTVLTGESVNYERTDGFVNNIYGCSLKE